MGLATALLLSPSPFLWGGARVIVGGGVKGSATSAHDPSVAGYRATSPEDWGGIPK